VYATKNGHTIKRLGRPGAEPHKIEEARKLLAAGNGILKVAKTVGLGTSTVQKLKNDLDAFGCLSCQRLPCAAFALTTRCEGSVSACCKVDRRDRV
jgi:hypothetical protein